MMSKNKRRHMIWRLLAPPSFPRFIRPRTTHRSEHVPPQNPSADVLHGSLCPLVIDASRTAFLAVHLLPRARGEEPLEQLRAANAERIVETLVRPGGVLDADSVHAGALHRQWRFCSP